jgi:hypothetical protein
MPLHVRAMIIRVPRLVAGSLESPLHARPADWADVAVKQKAWRDCEKQRRSQLQKNILVEGIRRKRILGVTSNASGGRATPGGAWGTGRDGGRATPGGARCRFICGSRV